MPKKKASRPKNGVLQTKPTDEQWQEILAYCHEHDLSASEYVRLCHLRRGKRPPSAKERDAINRPLGNPNPSEAGKAGAAARWGDKK